MGGVESGFYNLDSKAREAVRIGGRGEFLEFVRSELEGKEKELFLVVSREVQEQVSRPQVVKKLWAYLKEKNLQDPENKQWFTPDDLMKPIFGSERQKCFGMSKHLKDHLTNPNK